MRIALLTLEGLAAASAVRRFVLRDPGRLALVALSDPFRASAGGSLGQTRKRLAASGPRILPYLGLNFTAPRLAGAVQRALHLSTPPERTPLAATCARLGVPLTTVDDVNAPAFAERLRASGAELILTFHFDQILRAPVLEAAPRGGVNVHCGLLSTQRGPTPTIQALMDPEPRFGFTIHALTPRIDAGAVLAEQEVALPRGTSALSAARLLHEAAVPALEDVLAGRAGAQAAERGEAATAGRYHTFPTPAELADLARRGRHRGLPRHRASSRRDIPRCPARSPRRGTARRRRDQRRGTPRRRWPHREVGDHRGPPGLSTRAISRQAAWRSAVGSMLWRQSTLRTASMLASARLRGGRRRDDLHPFGHPLDAGIAMKPVWRVACQVLAAPEIECDDPAGRHAVGRAERHQPAAGADVEDDLVAAPIALAEQVVAQALLAEEGIEQHRASEREEHGGGDGQRPSDQTYRAVDHGQHGGGRGDQDEGSTKEPGHDPRASRP